MTVAASQGVAGWGAQTAKGSIATTWYRHKATRVDLGAQQDIRQFPPEVGGGFHPTGAYKRMGFGAGQIIMHPRLEETIGWLIYGAVGDLSTVNDTPEASMYRHIFNPPASFSDMKWMSVRKEVPGASGASDNLGEVLTDCRVMGLRFSTAAGGLLQCGATFVGRTPHLSRTGVDTWSWTNSYEEADSVPTAAASDTVKVGGTEQKATAITCDITNAYTTPDEELIVGEYHPDDFILQRQVLTARWTYKWQNDSLYKHIVSGTEAEAAGEIDWSPSVHEDEFSVVFKSPGNATSMSNPWALRIQAPEMSWQAAGPPTLVGGGWLAIEYIGIAQERSAGDTFQVELENKTASYSWPS